MPSPQQITDTMMQHDAFSRWLGIEVTEVKAGAVTLSMKVRQDMLNGFGIAHGGITYSLADSALAFASNSHGQKCVSVETSISHTRSLKEGDMLTAVAKEEHRSDKIAIYSVQVSSGNQVVALFKGTVYRTSAAWE
jgi:acyl-CoA thioesterase